MLQFKTINCDPIWVRGSIRKINLINSRGREMEGGGNGGSLGIGHFRGKMLERVGEGQIEGCTVYTVV